MEKKERAILLRETQKCLRKGASTTQYEAIALLVAKNAKCIRTVLNFYTTLPEYLNSCALLLLSLVQTDPSLCPHQRSLECPSLKEGENQVCYKDALIDYIDYVI